MLYIYPVSPPIEVEGQVVVLRPLADLPPEVEAFGLLEAVELNAIDNGSGTFFEDVVKQRKGEVIQGALDRAQRRYALGLKWITEQRARYAHTGDRHDEA